MKLSFRDHIIVVVHIAVIMGLGFAMKRPAAFTPLQVTTTCRPTMFPLTFDLEC